MGAGGMSEQTYLITGGAGFIGSALVRRAIGRGARVVNLDALTYAANPENLADFEGRPDYAFIRADLREPEALRRAFEEAKPDAVLHLAAESHVDRSIDGPGAFVETNVVGTFHLLQAARGYYEALPEEDQKRFRFVHVSTDEVFGELGPQGRFDEASPYAPNSPYSATKAASDMLARAWGRTYELPVVITNCSNNYGPRQFPEKLIPVVILAALEGRPIPVYGQGEQVRDWIYVDDHADGLLDAAARGVPGETYLFGGRAEARNIVLVRMICAALDGLRPESPCRPHADLISFVADRPGHDFRYAIDPGKAMRELGWRPTRGLEDGIVDTVRWYLDNPGWIDRLRARQAEQGGPRLGERLGQRAKRQDVRAA